MFIIRIALIAVGAIALLTGAWKAGLIQRTILRGLCTPVSMEVEMPKSLSQVMDLPINVFFFQNDNDELPEVRGTQRTLTLKGSRPSEKFLGIFKKGDSDKGDSKGANQAYTMRTVFLKKGDYRVKVVVGPYVWWKSFTVTKEDCLVECEFLKNMKRQLSISTKAYDRTTNKDISDKVRFNILYNDEWVPIESVNPKKIVSGTVWKIAAVADGYVDEYFSLLIDWFQDDLTIEASLERK